MQSKTANGPEAKEKVLVCVRIRPLQAQEVSAGEQSAWVALDATTLAVNNSIAEQADTASRPPSGGLSSRPLTASLNSSFGATSGPANLSSYQYGRVFAESNSSADVYSQSAKQLVLSAMSGYNCTVFAYGQVMTCPGY